MTRRGILAGLMALAAALLAPSLGAAYFPPEIGLPPVVTPVPPDPFGVPDGGGLGEPEAPDPGTGPSVQTPEPASVVTAVLGLAMAGAYSLRRRFRVRHAV